MTTEGITALNLHAYLTSSPEDQDKFRTLFKKELIREPCPRRRNHLLNGAVIDISICSIAVVGVLPKLYSLMDEMKDSGELELSR